jgi:hypothetical protein
MDLWPPFSRFLDHTHIQTHGRTPLDEWSARRRDLYLHRTTQQTDIHASSGIRNRDPSNQAAADLRLRRHGHWDRRVVPLLGTTRVGVWLELYATASVNGSSQSLSFSCLFYTYPHLFVTNLIYYHALTVSLLLSSCWLIIIFRSHSTLHNFECYKLTDFTNTNLVCYYLY